MARKKLEEPEKWITVNGQHLPVYKGGRIGAPGQKEPSKKKLTKQERDNIAAIKEENPNTVLKDVRDSYKKLKKEVDKFNEFDKKGGDYLKTHAKTQGNIMKRAYDAYFLLKDNVEWVDYANENLNKIGETLDYIDKKEYKEWKKLLKEASTFV